MDIIDIKQEPADGNAFELGAFDETSYEDTKPDLKFEHLGDQNLAFIKQEEINIKDEPSSTATITNDNTLELYPTETIYVPECKSEISKNHDHKNQFTSVSKPNSKKMRYVCQVCSFSTLNLKRHMKLHTADRPFACDHCGFKMRSKFDLQIHLRTHTGEKPFACDKCKFKTARSFDLKIHNMRIHIGEKPYTCNLCTYKSAKKSGVDAHMLVHTGEKPFICTLCDYKSAQKSNLVKHLRIHTGEKFACTECNYRSAEKSKLKIHMRIHTGEKLFKCNMCEYNTIRKSDLTRHMLKHKSQHTDETNKTTPKFTCDYCSYSSARRCHLNSHIRQVHRKNLVKEEPVV